MNTLIKKYFSQKLNLYFGGDVIYLYKVFCVFSKGWLQPIHLYSIFMCNYKGLGQ